VARTKNPDTLGALFVILTLKVTFKAYFGQKVSFWPFFSFYVAMARGFSDDFSKTVIYAESPKLTL